MLISALVVSVANLHGALKNFTHKLFGSSKANWSHAILLILSHPFRRVALQQSIILHVHLQLILPRD